MTWPWELDQPWFIITALIFGIIVGMVIIAWIERSV